MEPTMRRMGIVVLGLALIVGIAGALTMRPHLPPAERGRRLAERTGCFGCHGPGGIRGANNPGRTDKTVPNFEDDVMMYAKTPEEIHEWIHNGVTRKKAASKTWRAERNRGVLKMPAFKGRMSERDMDDLVAYVMAASGLPEPQDSLAAHGSERAEQLGCVGCHGQGGSLARPNPGSWKGYVPSWVGSDFPELVRDSTEFRQWVERGASRRFEGNRVAAFFLRRAVLKMPGYEKHLKPGDVPALWAYVTWLRSEASLGTARPMEEHHHD
jgi:mono/diheme cytochrome c family protein